MKFVYRLLTRIFPQRFLCWCLGPFLPKAVCLLLWRDGKVLAVSRKTDRTKFGLVGGKVDPGETLLQALLRETDEEAGIRPLDPKPIYEGICVGDVTFICTTFACDSFVGELHTNEAIDVAWVPPRLTVEGPFDAYNRDLFKVSGILV